MKHTQRRWTVLNLVASVLILVGIVLIGAKGAGPLPPLGSALNPGTGVWTLAGDSRLPTSATLRLAGLDQPVRVTFEPNGTPHIAAATDHDLFLTMGYLHATFRLFQMDLMRREGEGLLSQVIGRAALPADKFELQLGLLRTAQTEWNQMPPDDTARIAIIAYTAGINTSIAEQVRTQHLPVMFKMLGYQPALWTPVDSLVIQGIMTQTLDFSTRPLLYTILVNSLGYQRAMQWFPILPPNEQHPYDTSSHASQGIVPLDTSPQMVSASEANAASDILTRFASLPSWAIHTGSNSNNWAVDGTKTASGKPLMAGDPHLAQTIPAIWYQLECESPSYHTAGVSIPGTPVILIGRNQHISWSLTNTQNAATLYYKEQTDTDHPGHYYWKGAWRAMQQVRYSIPVKGGAPEALTVDLTVHGPVITMQDQTVSVWWVGALPSSDLDILLRINRASNFQGFRDALRSWHAPSQNFVYADDQGNIGLISAGYYPQVQSGQPWLPLSGDGSADVIGTIPFDDIPQVYNPPSHIVFSANQRMVGPDYPYYIGTALDDFDPGYRADAIYTALSSGSHFTPADMERLQNDTHDYLASKIVPALLAALDGQPLTTQQAQAVRLLRQWDGDMRVDSPAASIWIRFWMRYIYDTFSPWWVADKVPPGEENELRMLPNEPGSLSYVLGESLEVWTLTGPTNSSFTLPSGGTRTASTIMRQSFAATVAALATQLGPDPSTWAWGRLHTRAFPNLARIRGLGYGPRPASGDNRTVDAADGSPYLSTAGPSWRFVVDWSTGESWGVYPGGESENPLSPWYQNQIAAWWDGTYYPMLDDAKAQTLAGATTWTLKP